MSFDNAYIGTPPWDIGAPQPAIAELASSGVFRGRVLDIGCGTGEHALLAAKMGLEATGIDSSPRAIALARAKAETRGLTARFLVADALKLGSGEGQFDTVVDSGLFHVFDDANRERYTESLRGAAAPGAHLVVLCFSDRMPGDFGPRRVSEAELRTSFAEGWRLDTLEEARMSVSFADEGALAWRAVWTRLG